MTNKNRVDWNELADEQEDGSTESGSFEDLTTAGRYRNMEEELENCKNGPVVVEHPPSPLSSEEDILDLYCDENDQLEIEVLDNEKSNTLRTSKSAQGEIIDKRTNRQTTPSGKQPSKKRTGWRSTIASSNNGVRGEQGRNSPRPDKKRRLGEKGRQLPDRRNRRERKFGSKRLPTALQQRQDVNVMAVRWVRHGYEELVYQICNCNEAPNVVFAGLCYQQSEVYTMVLKNCVAKRRYWYDKSIRGGRPHVGAALSDFERAMRWRAKTVGRTSTSPGYDLAAFVLQNVATDGRCASNTTTPPLIVVTTDNMLDDSTVYRQLLLMYADRTNLMMSAHNSTTTSFYRNHRQHPCYVCGVPSGIVTHDNASIPMFTCWQHSASHMADSSADTTRVCNAVVVDMQFLREEDSPLQSGGFVCRLRLIKNGGTVANGGGGETTIAELVSLPSGVRPCESVMMMEQVGRNRTCGLEVSGLETVHASTCRESHYNVEDLFPSMPMHSGNHNGVVRYYDTTIGLVVDRMHCIATTFQRSN